MATDPNKLPLEEVRKFMELFLPEEGTPEPQIDEEAQPEANDEPTPADTYSIPDISHPAIKGDTEPPKEKPRDYGAERRARLAGYFSGSSSLRKLAPKIVETEASEQD